MALMPCRECGRTVSTEAMACPQCGAVNPTGTVSRQHAKPSPAKKKSRTTLKGVLGLIVLVVLASYFGNSGKGGDTNENKGDTSYVYTDHNIPPSTNPLANSLAPGAILGNAEKKNTVDGGKSVTSNVYTDHNVPTSTNPLASGNPPATICKVDWHSCSDNADVVNNYHDWSMVQVRCKSSTQDIAKYGTPSFPWFSFGSFRRGSDYPKTGIVTSIEPDAQYSNSFGAMVNKRGGCCYYLNRNGVIDVDLEDNR